MSSCHPSKLCSIPKQRLGAIWDTLEHEEPGDRRHDPAHEDLYLTSVAKGSRCHCLGRSLGWGSVLEQKDSSHWKRSPPLTEVALGWLGQVDVYISMPLKLEGAGRKGGIVNTLPLLAHILKAQTHAHVLLFQNKDISSIPRVIIWLSCLPFSEGFLCTKAIHLTAASF